MVSEPRREVEGRGGCFGASSLKVVGEAEGREGEGAQREKGPGSSTEPAHDPAEDLPRGKATEWHLRYLGERVWKGALGAAEESEAGLGLG